MAIVKSTSVTAKVTRVYTLNNGTDVNVIRDEEIGTVRCIYVRSNAAIDDVAQENTKFNVQCKIETGKVSVKTVNFGVSGDMDILDDIESAVLDLAAWSIPEETEE